MRHTSLALLSPLAALVLMAGCASVPAPQDGAQPSVMLVDSLYFTNAMNDQPDVQRTVRSVAAGATDVAYFPMAQLKQCPKDAAACSWGVLNAQRTVSAARLTPDGVAVKLDVVVDIDRRQQVNRPDYAMAMAIPSDIPALQSKQNIKQDLLIAYGKPSRIELRHGIVYQVCAMRLNAARQPIDQCNITDY